MGAVPLLVPTALLVVTVSRRCKIKPARDPSSETSLGSRDRHSLSYKYKK